MDRVAGKFSVVLQSHLFQEMRAMRADRSSAEREEMPISVTVFPEAIKRIISNSRSDRVS